MENHRATRSDRRRLLSCTLSTFCEWCGVKRLRIKGGYQRCCGETNKTPPNPVDKETQFPPAEKKDSQTMFSCTGYAAPSAKEPVVVPFHFERRDQGADDVEIKILYCGVHHSDLHQVRNEWGNTVYPCVPGHEIIGTATRVGGAVTTFKPGDIAGIGCMVDSCRECENCRKGLEQFCKPGFIATYNSPDPHTKRQTFGGYSSHIVVDRHFVL
jgi:hypothetical protein